MKLLYGLIPMLLAPIGIGLMSNDSLILTSKANPSTNSIRLDWTMNDLKNKTFKVYQKKPGSSEFQSVGTTNFESTKQVQVLNVHPNTGGSETFNTWDGETLTLPPSARLKRWMEEPNSENAKGYGKGLIEVTPVTMDEFNANPDLYLKDSSGNYKYDVIMFGSWDAFLNKDLNSTSLSSVKSFIETGRGVLIGHDAIRPQAMPMFNQLRTYMNVELPGDKNIDDTYIQGAYYVFSQDILKKKEGLLTNYPWVIDKSQLTVPQTHTTAQWAFGDVWFEFTNIDTTTHPQYEGIIYHGKNGKGTNNHYLTTWNNTAMIQTGHSNGNATSDEQKILANTLFYLNQLSSDNFLNDYSGQDLSAPNKPLINGHTFVSKGNIEVTFNQATDNGSAYEYYVQAEDKNGAIYKSNTVKETITSGIKGYSYVVDTNPTTIPDNTIEQTTNSPIKVNTTKNEVYVHIKAIDNIGNESETYHYKISDTTKPTINIVGNPTEWTNSDVKLNINAEDLDSGIDHIILPNGNIITGSSTSYVVSSNGNYTFKVVDKMGNETTQTVTVNKIDKNLPNITSNVSINTSKTQANIVLNFSDSESGVKYLELPDGTKITSSTSYTFTTTQNGIFPFTVVDNAGNKKVITVDIFQLNDSNASNISKIEYKLSGATVQGWTTYTGAFYITNEGTTTITARSYDNAGNISSEQTSVAKIDKTKPNNSSILIQLK